MSRQAFAKLITAAPTLREPLSALVRRGWPPLAAALVAGSMAAFSSLKAPLLTSLACPCLPAADPHDSLCEGHDGPGQGRGGRRPARDAPPGLLPGAQQGLRRRRGGDGGRSADGAVRGLVSRPEAAAAQRRAEAGVVAEPGRQRGRQRCGALGSGGRRRPARQRRGLRSTLCGRLSSGRGEAIIVRQAEQRRRRREGGGRYRRRRRRRQAAGAIVPGEHQEGASAPHLPHRTCAAASSGRGPSQRAPLVLLSRLPRRSVGVLWQHDRRRQWRQQLSSLLTSLLVCSA